MYFHEIFFKYSHKKDFSLFYASVGKKDISIFMGPDSKHNSLLKKQFL